MKPVDVSDLAKAIRRIEERDATTPSSASQSQAQSGKFTFRTLNGTLYVSKDEVVYVRASGNYSYIMLAEGEEIILERLGIIEGKLGNSHFIRAGRNLLLNRDLIFKVDRKHKCCILRTPAGREYSVELSAGGMEAVEKQ